VDVCYVLYSFLYVLCVLSGLLYNLPPHLRTSYSGMVLYGIIPAKVNNYNVYFQAIFARMRSAYKGREGFLAGSPQQRKWIEIVNKVLNITFCGMSLPFVCTSYKT
jgi:hypothetical protein